MRATIHRGKTDKQDQRLVSRGIPNLLRCRFRLDERLRIPNVLGRNTRGDNDRQDERLTRSIKMTYMLQAIPE